MGKRGKKKARAKRIDLEDLVAAELFKNNVTVEQTKDPVHTLFPYRAKMRGGPHWSDLHGHRHLVQDVIRASGGLLVRQQKMEQQLMDYFAGAGLKLDREAATVCVYRLRLMVRHLHRVKKSSGRVPKQYQPSLKGIVQEMHVSVKVGSTSTPDADDDDYDDTDDSDPDSGSDLDEMVRKLMKELRSSRF